MKIRINFAAEKPLFPRYQQGLYWLQY